MTAKERLSRNPDQEMSMRMDCLRLVRIDLPIDERLQEAKKVYAFVIGETTAPKKDRE